MENIEEEVVKFQHDIWPKGDKILVFIWYITKSYVDVFVTMILVKTG